MAEEPHSLFIERFFSNDDGPEAPVSVGGAARPTGLESQLVLHECQ